jgi:hypothetical protein
VQSQTCRHLCQARFQQRPLETRLFPLWENVAPNDRFLLFVKVSG